MRIMCPTMMMMTFKEIAREIREEESHHHRPGDPTKQKRDATDDANNQNKALRQAEGERNLVPGRNDVKTRFGVAFERSIPDAIPPGPPGEKKGVSL
jgi:hypothetical protein